MHLIGLPIGVKDGGGILEHITREIEVRCLPTAIPPAIDVDVTRAQHRRLGPRARPRRCRTSTILTDPDTTIATVVPPTVMEEKPAEEAAADGDAPSPR